MNDANVKNGVVRLAKALADHEVWHLDPFSRGQAWADLILLANDQNRTFLAQGRSVEVFRGQSGYSLKNLARRWRWGDEKVLGFMRWLESNGMIERKSNGVTSLITVVNYETYNPHPTATETDGEADTAPATGADAPPLAKTPDTEADTEADTACPVKQGVSGKNGGDHRPLTSETAEQKVEGRRLEGGGHARWDFSHVPTDEEVLAFGAGYCGCLATGAPKMPPAFVAETLADLHGRREFPARWQQLLVNRWRAKFRDWKGSPTANGHQPTRPENPASRRIGLEKKAAALEEQIAGHSCLCSAPPYESGEQAEFDRLKRELRETQAELKT